jgi:hypothetical protein
LTYTRMAALLATGVAVALTANGTQAVAKPAPRGSSCANPWRATYAHRKVVGDTGKVALKVTLKGQQITVAWHAQRGYHFCSLTLVEGRGQIFRSTNPQASYTYTDSTVNRTNGIKSLVATARSGR